MPLSYCVTYNSHLLKKALISFYCHRNSEAAVSLSDLPCMKQQFKNWFPTCVAALFVLVYLYTAIDKVQYNDAFAAAMNRSPLLQPFISILAWLIPLIELIIVLLLFLPATRRIGLLSGTVLMLLFTIYVGVMLARGGHLPCSCGGVISAMSWPAHLIFNSVLFTMGLTATLLDRKDFIAINRRSRTPENIVGKST